MPEKRRVGGEKRIVDADEFEQEKFPKESKIELFLTGFWQKTECTVDSIKRSSVKMTWVVQAHGRLSGVLLDLVQRQK